MKDTREHIYIITTGLTGNVPEWVNIMSQCLSATSVIWATNPLSLNIPPWHDQLNVGYQKLSNQFPLYVGNRSDVIPVRYWATNHYMTLIGQTLNITWLWLCITRPQPRTHAIGMTKHPWMIRGSTSISLSLILSKVLEWANIMSRFLSATSKVWATNPLNLNKIPWHNQLNVWVPNSLNPRKISIATIQYWNEYTLRFKIAIFIEFTELE